MYTRIPLITSSNKELKGRILNSNPVKAFQGSSIVPIAQVLRKDKTTSGYTWLDLTTEAVNAATGDFPIFGSASSMSNGDALYFRTQGDIDTHAIAVTIATPGVGSWGLEIQEWNETTDQWEAVSGLVDNSNALKNAAGTYKISYTSGAEGRIRLDDSQAKHVWHRIALVNFVSASVAPVLSRMWAVDTLPLFTDVTASHTSSPSDYSSLLTEILPAVGDYDVYIHPGPPLGVEALVEQIKSLNYTCVREYLATDGTWKTLTATDPSNFYTALGSYSITWVLPTDWTQKNITINNVAYTGWIERCRISAVSVEGTVAPYHTQIKTRSLGAGNSFGYFYHPEAKTYRAAIFTIGGSLPASDIVLSLIVAEQTNPPASVSFTIPANTISSDLTTAGEIVFASTLSVLANQSVLLSKVSGGVASDLEVQVI